MKRMQIVVSAPWPEGGDKLDDAILQGKIAAAMKAWVGEPASDLGIAVSAPEIIEVKAPRKDKGTTRAKPLDRQSVGQAARSTGAPELPMAALPQPEAASEEMPDIPAHIRRTREVMA